MSDDILNRVSLLKKRAEETTAKLNEASTRRAIAKAKIDELTQRLSERLGTTDWAKARKALDKLHDAALAATEALAEALDGIDIDLD